MKKPTIGVIGAGAIGGSIIKAGVNAGYGVLAYDEDKSLLSKVIQANGGFADNLKALVERVDIIFVAVSGGSFNEIVDEVMPYLRPGQILSDVSSTKQSPVAALSLAPKGVIVVGGHPMAGTADKGFNASSADMFKGCVWVLCPVDGYSVPNELIHFVMDIGAGRTVVCSPEEHDLAVAAISHGVQVSASSLAAAVNDVVGANELAWSLAAGGFRDSTRIADSSPEMWVPILHENKDNVLEVIDANIERLSSFKTALLADDEEAIRSLIVDGNTARTEWITVKDKNK